MIWLVGFALFWAGLLGTIGEVWLAKALAPRLLTFPTAWGVVVVSPRLAIVAGLTFGWGLSRLANLRIQVLIETVTLSAHVLFCLSMTLIGSNVAIQSSALLVLQVAGASFHFAALSVLLPSWLGRTKLPGNRHAYPATACYFLGMAAGGVAYTFLVEPFLPLSFQTTLWSAGLVGLFALMVGIGILTWQQSFEETCGPLALEPASPTWRQRLSWFLLAALAGPLPGLLTAFITTDLSPVPLLWLVPTVLALLAPATALLGSAWKKPALHHQLMLAGGYGVYAFFLFSILLFQLLPGVPWFFFVLPCLVLLAMPHIVTWPGQIGWTGAMFWLFFAGSSVPQGWLIAFIGFLCLGLYATCRGCYGDAVALRPSARHLPEFFLWLSLGQILGSFLGQWVPPLIFDSMVEVPLLVGAALVGRLMLVLLNWQVHGKNFNLRDLKRT